MYYNIVAFSVNRPIKYWFFFSSRALAPTDLALATSPIFFSKVSKGLHQRNYKYGEGIRIYMGTKKPHLRIGEDLYTKYTEKEGST